MYDAETVREVHDLYREKWKKTEISKMLGIDYKTVLRLLSLDPDNMPKLTRNRPSKLEPYRRFIETMFVRHGSCEIIRQKLLTQKGLDVSLRRLQQYVKPLREKLAEERLALFRQKKADFAARRLHGHKKKADADN